MNITKEKLNELDQRYRAHLVNSLSGFKSANLIGTINQAGQTNLSIVSSVFHIGANPPLVGTIFRPHSVPRHTLENILETKHYTINQVTEEIYQQAHQTSARYNRDLSEFNQTNLEEEYINDFKAPFVKSSLLKYSLELKEHQLLKINNTELIIGEIRDIIVESSAVRADGYIDIESLSTVAISGLDSYHNTQRLSRLSYAKQDRAIVELNLDGSTD